MTLMPDPRCGKPMWRYTLNRQRRQPDVPVCGRPKGHHPPCRTAEAIAYALSTAKDRWQSARKAGATRTAARRRRR